MTIQTRSSSRTSRATPPQRLIAVVQRKHAVIKRTPLKSRPGVKAMTDESELSPEEAERLRIRRDRNKAAAARCRKRRLDQISTLSDDVADHEDKKRMLEQTISQLKSEKKELEYILAQHQAECHFNPNTMSCLPDQQLPIAVKSEPVMVEAIDQIYVVHKSEVPSNRSREGGLKPKRPLTLNITPPMQESKLNSAIAGITIDTPSNIVSSLGFDSLLTSTGLTPTTNIITPISFNISTSNAPSCSSQQRTSELSLADLNTPSTETLSLVSL
jgi:fos-like antigen